jgi:hypothetical protein
MLLSLIQNFGILQYMLGYSWCVLLALNKNTYNLDNRSFYTFES